jgi:ATP-dependent helicase/nuclease subunit A
MPQGLLDMKTHPAYEHNGKTVSAEAFYAIACDPRRNVAVEACAGAGKTWMLVSRIVRALLEGVDENTGQLRVLPHEILAITFTKRAASEMRERLQQWLSDFANADETTLTHELRIRGVGGENGILPSSNITGSLSKLYQSILSTGRQVQIRTFHSWFAAMLRNAPIAVLRQLDLSPNHELLEDDSQAKALVWRRFYQALIDQPECRADFEAVVFEHGRFQTEKALQAALDKRVEFELADARGVVAESVLGFEVPYPEFRGLASPAQALDGEVGKARWLGWAKALGGEANKTPQKAANAIIEAFAQQDVNARLDTLRKGFFVANEDRLTTHLQKFSAAQEVEPELQRLCAARHQHGAWRYQQRMARLTRVLISEFGALKREHGWVDMNDVERAARVMLGDPVLSGWVQQRLDARVKHLLIDEFQDTNPLQWQALQSWLGSYAGSGGGRAPSVFLVGDPKQSIYRFRRAEPQVFKAAKAFVREGLSGDLLSCDHTRRNATQVIGAVNAVMATAMQEDHYEGFRTHTTSSEIDGLVCRLPQVPRDANATGAGELQSNDWRDSLVTPRELPEETLRTLEARQAAAWIAQQIDGGVRAQDIMVLSRKRASLAPMQDELRALQIPALVGEKTDLIDCCEVQDIVALLDVLVSPQHDLSMARVLKSPLFGVADDALVRLALLRQEYDVPWFELLQKQEHLEANLRGLAAILSRWKAWISQLPPHDALQAIFDDGDVLARFAVAVPAAQREAVLANLRALPGAALQLGGGRFATPYGFVRALKSGGLQAPAVVAQGAVRLLTIHGAKGLEAEVVLLLDTDTAPRKPDTMGVLVDWPGEASAPVKFIFLASESQPPACAVVTLQAETTERQREELNALYVAITRARTTLAMSGIESHRPAEGSWWARLSDTALPLQPPVALGASGRASALQVAASMFYLTELPVALASQAQIAIKKEASGLSSADRQVDKNAASDPAARVGKALHRLLEWGRVSSGDIAAAAGEFELSPAQGEEAAAMAQRILRGEGAWAWNEDCVDWAGNEVELMVNGETLRLDRLVRRRDTGEWWVLDYKSGAAPQDDPTLTAQLGSYRKAVQAIYPTDKVCAAFLTGRGALIGLNWP